jgi:hypothetical protein
MDITFEQDLYYSNREHLSLEDVAKSLLSLDQTARAIPAALEKLFEDARVESISLSLDELKSGSLSETIRYRLKVALQHHIEEHGGELGRLSNKPTERKRQIAAWLATAVIVFAIKQAADSFRPNVDKPHIEETVNVVLDHGHEITGLDRQQLREAIREALEETPNFAQNAVNITRPAKRDPEASISIDGQAVISNQALSEIPSALPDQQVKEKSVELEGAIIVIRATDRDSGRKGWGATIPEFSNHRMRVSVAPGNNLDLLAHKDIVVGNVTIFYTLDDRGNVIRPHAHIFSVELDDRIAIASVP